MGWPPRCPTRRSYYELGLDWYDLPIVCCDMSDPLLDDSQQECGRGGGGGGSRGSGGGDSSGGSGGAAAARDSGGGGGGKKKVKRSGKWEADESTWPATRLTGRHRLGWHSGLGNNFCDFPGCNLVHSSFADTADVAPPPNNGNMARTVSPTRSRRPPNEGLQGSGAGLRSRGIATAGERACPRLRG